jgi:hypothetical protein
MRIRSDFFVQAYVRQRNAQNAFAVVRRRGAAEAGAIFVLIDRRDGHADLYGPAPQSLVDGDAGHRRFQKISAEGATLVDAEARLAREIRFDPDVWIIDAEDPAGDAALDLV